MERQQILIELLKMRLQNGEELVRTGVEHGDYIVELSSEPPMVFGDDMRPQVNNVLRNSTGQSPH